MIEFPVSPILCTRKKSITVSASGSTGGIPGMIGAYRFNGPEYVPDRDQERLAAQAKRIFNVMRDQKWRLIAEISSITGDPENSVSAQLRHFRKTRFGSHLVNRHHIKNGLFEYQLIPNEKGEHMITSQSVKSKKFTVTVSPEYCDGRILVLTKEEAKTIAESIICRDDQVSSLVGTDLFSWAEEVYFG